MFIISGANCSLLCILYLACFFLLIFLFFFLGGALARGCAKNADNLGAGAAKSADDVAVKAATSMESALARATAKSLRYKEDVLDSDENISYEDSTGIIILDNTK